MSLVAALLVGSSAFAIENVKVSGDAKLFYTTADMDPNDLFSKAGSAGQAAVGFSATADLAGGVSGGMSTTALSTLGLENNIVGATFGSTSAQTQWWVSEMHLTKTFGKTTGKVGRQQLDTPFAFTETWSTAYNTFDAMVLMNQDIPGTTLVGAWVGKHNGASNFAVVNSPVNPTTNDQTDSFSTFGTKGAYTAGIVNNSFEPLSIQAWYYDVVSAADAMWAQLDLSVSGIVFGAQYASVSPKGIFKGADDSSAVAAKLGYESESFSISAAYSQTDDKGAVQIANVATMDLVPTSGTFGGGGAASKLYTEAWWNFGYVGAADNVAMNLTASYDAKVAGFAAYYTMVDFDKADTKMTELTLEATKSYGPVDTALVYIMTEDTDKTVNGGDSFNTIQVYLTYNF